MPLPRPETNYRCLLLWQKAIFRSHRGAKIATERLLDATGNPRWRDAGRGEETGRQGRAWPGNEAAAGKAEDRKMFSKKENR